MIENTEAQARLHPALISPEAASVIEIAKAHGALGWKVNGAGGDGGSLTILSEPERIDQTGHARHHRTGKPTLQEHPDLSQPLRPAGVEAGIEFHVAYTLKSGYTDLVDRLNRFPQGAPPSETLYQILKILFSEREAGLVAQLPIKPFTAPRPAGS